MKCASVLSGWHDPEVKRTGDFPIRQDKLLLLLAQRAFTPSYPLAIDLLIATTMQPKEKFLGSVALSQYYSTNSPQIVLC